MYSIWSKHAAKRARQSMKTNAQLN